MDTLKKEYQLVGVFNPLNIMPGFVTPVFMENGKLYLANCNEFDVIESFVECDLETVSKMKKLIEMDTNIQKSSLVFTKEDEIIYALQMDSDYVYLAGREKIHSYIKEFFKENSEIKDRISIFPSNTFNQPEIAKQKKLG